MHASPMIIKPTLTHALLKAEAKAFCEDMAGKTHPLLFGVTDGKAVGTYVEHLFEDYLRARYRVQIGSSAKGIDLPGASVNTDIKVTSLQKPQSSCPFRTAAQKVYGLGYNLLVFVYEKIEQKRTCRLKFSHCAFIKSDRTGDYTLTKRLREMVDDGANREDILSLLVDRGLPGDDVTLGELAERVLAKPPKQGYLTISNAFQWRLQYQHAIELKGSVAGITNYEW